MDNNNQADARDDTDQADNGTDVNQASAAIIGTNLTGMNTTPFAGGIVAPAAALAATETTDDDTGDIGATNFDALEQFGSGRRDTGDQGVSSAQSEAEAGELNG